MHRCRHFSTPLRVFSTLLALTICGGSARDAESDSVFLRFEVFGGPGLHFLTLQVNVQQSQEQYSLAVEAETRGLADLFVDLRSMLEARGRIAGDALLPEAVRAETHRRGVDLHTRIDYGANGAVVAEATPPPTGAVTPVSPAQMRGTVDQLTAYLELVASPPMAPARWPSPYSTGVGATILALLICRPRCCLAFPMEFGSVACDASG